VPEDVVEQVCAFHVVDCCLFQDELQVFHSLKREMLIEKVSVELQIALGCGILEGEDLVPQCTCIAQVHGPRLHKGIGKDDGGATPARYEVPKALESVAHDSESEGVDFLELHRR
jgi:hypothetical protein